MALVLAASIAAGSPIPDGEVKSGTAFFVTPRGRLVTSAHFLTGCGDVEVWPPGKAKLQARIISIDRALDLGMLEIAGASEPYAIPNGLRSPSTGEEVSIIAYGVRRDAPREPQLLDGTVVGGGTTELPSRLVVIRARLSPGSSGAPVIDGTGALIGVIIGRYAAQSELAVAVPKNELTGFLARNGVMIPPGSGDKLAEAETLLRNISVLVQCAPAIGIKPEKSGIMVHAHRAHV